MKIIEYSQRERASKPAFPCGSKVWLCTKLCSYIGICIFNFKEVIKWKNGKKWTTGFDYYISNLEWCDNTYNSQYPKDLRVYCFDLDKYFKSATEASVHTGVCRTSIVKTCRGQLSQAGGFWWCYAKDKDKRFP